MQNQRQNQPFINVKHLIIFLLTLGIAYLVHLTRKPVFENNRHPSPSEPPKGPSTSTIQHNLGMAHNITANAIIPNTEHTCRTTQFTAKDFESNIIGSDPTAKQHIVQALLYIQASETDDLKERLACVMKHGAKIIITPPDSLLELGKGIKGVYLPQIRSITIEEHHSPEKIMSLLRHELLGHAFDHTRWTAHEDKKYHFSADCYTPENKTKLIEIIRETQATLANITALLQKEYIKEPLTKDELSLLQKMRTYFTAERYQHQLAGLFVKEDNAGKIADKKGSLFFLNYNNMSSRLTQEHRYRHPNTGINSYLLKPEDLFQASIFLLQDSLSNLKESKAYTPREYEFEFVTHMNEKLPPEFIAFMFPTLDAYVKEWTKNKKNIMPINIDLNTNKKMINAICEMSIKNPEATLFNEDTQTIFSCIHRLLNLHYLKTNPLTEQDLKILQSSLTVILKYQKAHHLSDSREMTTSAHATMGKVLFFQGKHEKALRSYLKYHAQQPNTNDASDITNEELTESHFEIEIFKKLGWNFQEARKQLENVPGGKHMYNSVMQFNELYKEPQPSRFR